MFIIKKNFLFICDDCGFQASFLDFNKASDVRRFGWAISKDYKKCYCPKCAPKHLHVGRPRLYN